MSVKSLKTGNRSFSLLAGNTPEHHVLLAETTVGAGGVASITFSNIDQSYQHLQLRGIARNTYSGASIWGLAARFNNDSATNYTIHELYGTGSTAGSYGAATQDRFYIGTQTDAGDLANSFAVFVADILDYTSTSKYKTVRSLNGSDLNGSGGIALYSTVWMSTSAITSIKIDGSLGGLTALAQYSTFQLYGVK